jgi:hypothetical protein
VAPERLQKWLGNLQNVVRQGHVKTHNLVELAEEPELVVVVPKQVHGVLPSHFRGMISVIPISATSCADLLFFPYSHHSRRFSSQSADQPRFLNTHASQ